MHISLKQRSILALCIVALSFTLLNIVVRLMNTGFGPFTQVYLRIGLGWLLTMILFHKEIHLTKFNKITKRDWSILASMGIIGYGIAVVFVTVGVLHTKLLNASIISSTTPFFIFLFTIFVLRKPFRSYLFIFLLLTFYGVFIIATGSLLPFISNFNSGDFYVLLYAATTGVFIIGRKLLSHNLNNSEIAVIVMFFAFLTSFIAALIFGETLSLSGFINSVALFGLLLGGALNLTATKLQNFGFHHLNPVVGSQLLLLSNLFALLFGYIFYKEIISQVEFLGAILVILGVWLYIRYEKD